MYNKRDYRKTNDKKLLHKIGKRWVTVSIAMLTMLSGNMMTSLKPTHASAKTPKRQTQQQVPKERLNQTLQKPRSFQRQNSNVVYNKKPATLKDVASEASDLHNKILAHALNTMSTHTNSVHSDPSTRNSNSASNVESTENNSSNQSQISSGNNNETSQASESTSQSVFNNEAENQSSASDRTNSQSASSESASSSSATESSAESVTKSSASVESVPASAIKVRFNSAYSAYESKYGNEDRIVASVNAGAVDSKRGLMLDAISKPTRSNGNTDKPTVNNSASSTNVSNDMNTLNLGTKSDQAKRWNVVQHEIDNNDYDRTEQSNSQTLSASTYKVVTGSNGQSSIVATPQHASFNSAYLSYEAQMGSTDAQVAKTNSHSNNNQVNNKKPLLKDNASVIEPESYYFEGTPINTGNDEGLNYEVYQNGGVEFTDGTAQSNLTMFLHNSRVSDAKAIKFDNDVDVSHVKNMTNMLSGDSNLQSISFSNNFDTNNVTNMSGMFYDDHALTSINFNSDFDTSNVSDMKSMFQSDIKLTTLILPKTFNTSNSTNGMGVMFSSGLIFHNGFKFYPSKLPKLVIQSPNTKIDGLGESDPMLSPMYKQLTEKDSNGNNYTLSTPNDFSKGNIGTFVNYKNPVPVNQDTDAINFYDADSGNSYIKSLSNIKGTAGVQEPISNIPSGYKLAKDQDSTITLDNMTHDVYVVPTNNNYNTHNIPVGTKSVTFKGVINLDFHDGKKNLKTISLDYSIPTIVDARIQADLLNIAKDDKGTLSANVPADYLNRVIDNFNTENYSYDNNVQKGSYNNKFYVDPNNSADYNDTNNTYTNSPITLTFSPNKATDTINYIVQDPSAKNNGQIVGQDQKFTGNSSNAQDDDNTTFDVNENNAQLPTGYQLVNPNNTFNYDGSTHNVYVKGKEAQATIYLEYLIDGQDQTKLDHSVTLNGTIGQSVTAYPDHYEQPNFIDEQLGHPWIHVLDGKSDSTTFTYVAHKANNINVVYTDVTPNTVHYNRNVGHQTISDKDIGNALVGQTVNLGQSGANDSQDVYDVLNIPKGYYLINKINPITIYQGNGQTRVSMMLMAMPSFNHHTNKKTSNSASTTPSSRASSASSSANIKPHSTNVKPSSEASSTTSSSTSIKPSSKTSSAINSSTNVEPNSTSVMPTRHNHAPSSARSSDAPSNVTPNIVMPSSTTNSVSSASTSTESSSNAASSVPSARQSNSKASVGSSAVSKIKSASSAKPLVHKISKKSVSAKHIESAAPKAHVNKINKVNHRAVSEASNMPKKAVQANSTNSVESGHQVATFEVHEANNNVPYVVASESEPTNVSATNVESAPVNNASNDEAVPTNSVVAKGTVASHNINNTNTNNAHKLPQTNEASSHSVLVAIVALLAGLSLMGVDIDYKHNI